MPVSTLELQSPPFPQPILKWAGGKRQLLPELLNKSPNKFNNYIEPFIGGGALFFTLSPEKSIISDSNPELINLYKEIADNVDSVISILQTLNVDENTFYEIRSLNYKKLDRTTAAARTLYLNRTCFNGLYRVNQKGHFNVPYGKYKNPLICNSERLQVASVILKKSTILCADYKDILQEFAKPGDFIYLDPPYIPISQNADFKRYTKEQFRKENHKALRNEVLKLTELGCHVLLTNSNHPLVHELYRGYSIDIINTRRNINSKGDRRYGEDVIISSPPRRKLSIQIVPDPLPLKVQNFPATRFMGSKEKLLTHIWNAANKFSFETILDLFSGSGVVGYMFKTHGKKVITNDYMSMSATFAHAMIENNKVLLSQEDVEKLISVKSKTDKFVQNTFKGLYYTDKENVLIDRLRTNIQALKNPFERSIAMSALMRACLKKRPRGIFTYTGHRYDDGRKDLRTSLKEHFRIAAKMINGAVFDNGKRNKARHGDALSVRHNADLVYIDPPYYSPLSDNEYVRRYHFLEGLARNWEGVEMQWHTKTKKFKNYPTPFSSKKGAKKAFDKLFNKFQESILIVSYSSNSLPTCEEITSLMAKYKSHVEVIDIDYRYSFGTHGHKINDNNNKVKEYIFIGF